MKKFLKMYGVNIACFILWITLFYIDTANAFNFAQPIKTKTHLLVNQLKTVGTCLAIIGVVWAAFLVTTGQKMYALKYALGVFLGGIILSNLQPIVNFMGFNF